MQQAACRKRLGRMRSIDRIRPKLGILPYERPVLVGECTYSECAVFLHRSPAPRHAPKPFKRLTRLASTRRPREEGSAGRRKRLSRVSQQKPARARIAIHPAFDGQQQFRSGLDLIDHQQAILPDEGARICLCSGADCLVIQEQLARARDLATISPAKVLLPTWRAPVDHHDTGVRKQAPRQPSAQHGDRRD
jgi:hypothetical protein